MGQDLPDISYERSMNHNYLVLSKCDFFGEKKDKDVDYRTRMLLENHIPGLLPVTHRLVNGESRYYYEINSLQSLDRLYDKKEIRYEELKRLLSGCVRLFDRLEEYLLDGTQIIIKPELVYLDVEKMEPYFVCYPDYEGDVRLAFMEFVDGLLTKIDHTDEHAVMLGYQVYRYTRNPNYVLSEIGKMMEHTIVQMAEKENRAADSAIQEPGATFGTGFAGYSAECKSDEDDVEIPEERQTGGKSKSVGDLIGGIFCILISLCAGAIILGARVLKMFTLSGNNELYLYGAIAMAVAAAALFFACYIKKRKQDKELEESSEDEDEDYDAYENPLYSPASVKREPAAAQSGQNALSVRREPTTEKSRSANTQRKYVNETVYLGDRVVEERVLCGRVNGREVNIPLNRLPMTIGKLAGVSDFVINDTAVSKMHARFEEHDGRVYVCDLNSTNGTVRNGELLDINRPVALEPGDRLRFGRTSFTYC